MSDENERIIAERHQAAMAKALAESKDGFDDLKKEEPKPRTFEEALLIDTWRSMLVILCHSVLLAFFATCFYAVEKFLRWLFGEIDPTLFDYLRLRYMFDTLDFLVFVALSISALTWLRHPIRPRNDAL